MLVPSPIGFLEVKAWAKRWSINIYTLSFVSAPFIRINKVLWVVASHSNDDTAEEKDKQPMTEGDKWCWDAATLWCCRSTSPQRQESKVPLLLHMPLPMYVQLTYFYGMHLTHCPSSILFPSWSLSGRIPLPILPFLHYPPSRALSRQLEVSYDACRNSTIN